MCIRDSFSFTPTVNETVQLIFIRFDASLDRANTLANLDISFPFRSWMLLALLRLPPKKWPEYLKDMGHRFPRDADEYQAMKDFIVREKTLETQVGTLSSGASGKGPGVSGAYFQYGHGFSSDCIPLYLCLGAPSDTGPSEFNQHHNSNNCGTQEDQNSVTLLSLEGVEDSDSDFSDEETWLAESAEDHYSAERLAAERQKGSDPAYVSDCYWALRNCLLYTSPSPRDS